MNEVLLVRGAELADGTRTDLLVQDGIIAETGSGLDRPGARVIDASGLIALPGLVDLHVHFREPGFEASETILTGSRAAAAGGFTTVFTMPNTSPVADTAGVVEQELALGEAAGYVTVQPIGAVTIGQKGERLAELGAMATSRARVRVFSDDGFCVWDPVIMRRALEYVKAFGGVIAQHAQDPRLTEGAQMNEGVVSAELGLAGWPAVAEEAIIARDVLLAEHVGSRLHVCHLSTAGSVDIIRWAKKRGIDVTAEVTPHHLLLTEDRVRGYDARFKVNPPLRTSEDVEAVREGLADGTIDIVASGHDPRGAEDKRLPFADAEPGMAGAETLLAMLLTLERDGRIDMARVFDLCATAPARLLGVEAGVLAQGYEADIALIDPEKPWIVDRRKMEASAGNTPFDGQPTQGRVTALFKGGVAVKL